MSKDLKEKVRAEWQSLVFRTVDEEPDYGRIRRLVVKLNKLTGKQHERVVVCRCIPGRSASTEFSFTRSQGPHVIDTTATDVLVREQVLPLVDDVESLSWFVIRTGSLLDSAVSGWIPGLDLQVVGKHMDDPLPSLVKDLYKAGVMDMWHTRTATTVVLKPTHWNFDDEGRPHCADGPSVTWLDGTKHYHWHGVEVPFWVIEEPNSITVQKAFDEQNIEVRRVMIEILGWERLLADTDYEVLDEDVDGKGQLRRLILIRVPNGDDRMLRRPVRGVRDSITIGSIDNIISTTSTSQNLNGLHTTWSNLNLVQTSRDEHILLVEVTCPSTKDRYHLRVPPNMKTCAEAVAWTFDETSESYDPVDEA